MIGPPSGHLGKRNRIHNIERLVLCGSMWCKVYPNQGITIFRTADRLRGIRRVPTYQLDKREDIGGANESPGEQLTNP